MLHKHDINLKASSWPKCARELVTLPPLKVALDVCQFTKRVIRLVCAVAPESIWSNVRATTSPFSSHNHFDSFISRRQTQRFIPLSTIHLSPSCKIMRPRRSCPLVPSVCSQISARRSPSAQIHNHGIQVLQVYIYRALPILSGSVLEADDQTAPRSAFRLTLAPAGRYTGGSKHVQDQDHRTIEIWDDSWWAR